ncbi:hypothetical protein JYU34_010668 [Plutella xylostella]|uniref:Uncharacterized protein n=1 Tax=Plutella xylostella TaxID=51655 RepID=A0ABQ7QIK5_PLUXY|nr:hypothetical protein JYU34_010668 [Plutella xylostella]
MRGQLETPPSPAPSSADLPLTLHEPRDRASRPRLGPTPSGGGRSTLSENSRYTST